MSTNEPLKPCPFGCVGERRMNGNHFSASFWVSCEACCIRGRIARYPEDAAEYWNRRPAAIPTGEGLESAYKEGFADGYEEGLNPHRKTDVNALWRESETCHLLASITGAQAEGVWELWGYADDHGNTMKESRLRARRKAVEDGMVNALRGCEGFTIPLYTAPKINPEIQK